LSSVPNTDTVTDIEVNKHNQQSNAKWYFQEKKKKIVNEFAVPDNAEHTPGVSMNRD